MLSRMIRHIRRQLTAPADHDWSNLTTPNHHSCYLTGWFDFRGDCITGWAENTLEQGDQDLTVAVIRGRDVIASTRVGHRSATVGWRFEIATGSEVSGDDLLHERVRVLVRDGHGEIQMLQLEGSTQLALIRELITDLEPPFLEIDFREGGNSCAFAMEGWSGQETIHRWTEGTQSTLTFSTPPHYCGYILQLLLWPFTVAGSLPEQRLRVLVNETEIAHFSVTRQSFLSCSVPSVLLPTEGSMTIRFLHADATSPASLGVSNDVRRLGLAFKKIKITPVVTDPD
jgi:hypothetical protein